MLTEKFKKSSFCDTSACVEVAKRDYVVVVRNSNDPNKELIFSAVAWKAFLAGVQDMEFEV